MVGGLEAYKASSSHVSTAISTIQRNTLKRVVRMNWHKILATATKSGTYEFLSREQLYEIIDGMEEEYNECRKLLEERIKNDEK